MVDDNLDITTIGTLDPAKLENARLISVSIRDVGAM